MDIAQALEDVLEELASIQKDVNKLKTGTLTAHEELQMEIPYSPELVRAFWLAAGGSYTPSAPRSPG